MWVFKHVEFVDDVELGLPKVRQVVGLSSALLFAPLLVLSQLHELHVDLVLDAALPAAHLSVVKGGQYAALRLLACHLDGSDRVLSAMSDSINARQEEVERISIRHRVTFHHANIYAAEAGSNDEVVATGAVRSASERLTLL